MPRISRQSILARLHDKIAHGRPIVGGGAGTGLSAKCEEAGGIDLIVIYNSGRYRMAGRGSLAGLLAYGNANEIVCEMAREVLPVVERTPVLAGVNGTDPFMLRDEFLHRLIALGFSGIQNFPTVGLIDGTFRANLEETGMGYALEVELVRHAHARCCVVRLWVQDDLHMEIGDDGVGLPATPRAGVGLISMRERAAELGGSCVVNAPQGDGTRISVQLPLSPERDAHG